jgi:Kef-type K+ transport system membrane component KefB
LFAAVTVVALFVIPPLLRAAIARLGHRVSEPEFKLILAVLLGLGGLATQAGSEAVLPAYLVGLVVAGVFMHDRVLMDRLRSIAFAFFTPFFFLHALFGYTHHFINATQYTELLSVVILSAFVPTLIAQLLF